MNSEGNSIQSSMDNTTTATICNQIGSNLLSKAKSIVRDLDAADSLKFLRIKTKKNEILVGCEDEFTIITIQN